MLRLSRGYCVSLGCNCKALSDYNDLLAERDALRKVVDAARVLADRHNKKWEIGYGWGGLKQALADLDALDGGGDAE